MIDLVRQEPATLRDIVSPSNAADYLADPSAAALISYYLKTFGRDVRRVVDEHFALREQATDLAHYPPLAHLSPQQRDAVFRNIGALQLTYGCDGKCPDCGFDALPGVREHMPFPIVQEIVQHYAKDLLRNTCPCYWASDALDYDWIDPAGRHWTYADVEKLFIGEAYYRPYLSTVIPAGREHVAHALTMIDRVSFLRRPHARDPQATQAQFSNIYDLVVITPGNLNVRTSMKGNAQSKRLGETGIGCMQGMLLTPRGLYSVVQNPGIHAESPQKQFVIPFKVDRPDMPIVPGADIRDILEQHIPLQVDIGFAGVPPGEREVTAFSFFEDPQGAGMLVTLFRGTTVTDVMTPEQFFAKLAPDMTIDELLASRRNGIIQDMEDDVDAISLSEVLPPRDDEEKLALRKTKARLGEEIRELEGCKDREFAIKSAIRDYFHHVWEDNVAVFPQAS